MALRQEHARIECAGQHHVPQALPQIIRVKRPRPVANRVALVVERADHRISEIADVGRADVDRRTGNLACFRNADMAEVRHAAGAYGWLGHMQRKARGAGHQDPPAAV